MLLHQSGVAIVSWLAFLPLVVLALIVATLRTSQRESEAMLREDILLAALMIGVSIALGTEALSAFQAISTVGVLGFWLAAIAAAGVALAWRWRRTGPPAPLRIPQLGAVDGFLIGGIVTITLVLLVVAWLAPPQSSDSIGYHMSRVMHWIQNHSIAPYPTSDSPQLYQPPFAEMVRLHLYLLAGGDRSGCLLQWFAAMGALLAASLLARDLGGSRRAQIFAAVFAVTLPIGVTQATSGKNGWVEALWLLALAYFGNAVARRGQQSSLRSNIIAAFAALGLELMTKITSWLFTPPLVILSAVRAFGMPRTAYRRLVAPVVVGSFLVCALIFPYLARNLSVYGNPLADPVFRSEDGLNHVTPAIVASNVIRNAFFQFGTESAFVNEALMGWVTRAHRFIGADPFDPRTTRFGPFRISSPTRVEEVAFSPLHILLVIGTGLVLLVSRRLRGEGFRMPYFAALVAGYVLFCATVRWQPPICRLLMPLLVLAAPLVAVVAADAFKGRVVPALSAILFVACLPYAGRTYARPISFEPGEGIFVTPRIELYFARIPELRETYGEVARVVRDSRTRNLGVVFKRTGQPEYLLWMLLKDANPPVRIENVAVTDASGKLASHAPFRDFRPELVVVFASDSKTPHFDPEIVAAGTRLAFVRSYGSAGFYAPVMECRDP
jgi:4-amino-4-deoxy-L-arabinose transferase-like glycosyltransferase